MADPFAETCYQKNYLKEVIARVDFLSPLPGLDTALPRELSDQACKAFPIPEPVEAFMQEVKVGPLGVAPGERQRFTEWRFHGKEREKTLTFSPAAVHVRYTTYRTYELVKDEFGDVLAQIAALFEGATLKRVGLRYVNQLDLEEQDPTDWSAYLAAPLLSLFEFPAADDRAALSRVFHNLELAFEGFNLRFRSGMHNPDYPARIRRKVFVLDLDAYTGVVTAINEVPRLLDEFHGTIQRYFESSITKSLRELMRAT